MRYKYDAMADLLGMNLFDVEFKSPMPDAITPELKEKFLNIAQDKVVGMIHSDYFPDLQVISALLTLTASGYYDLYDLATVPIFRGHQGIIGVEQTLAVATTCRRHTLAQYIDLVKRQKKSVSAAADKPIYYIVGSFLYVWPNAGASTKIKIYYMKTPLELREVYDRNSICLTQAWTGSAAMTLNGTLVTAGVAYMATPTAITFYNTVAQTAITADVIGTLADGTTITEQLAGATAGETVTSVNQFKTITSITSAERTGSWEVGTAGDCILNADVQDIIVEYASYLGYKAGHAYDRAKESFENVIGNITNINRKFEPEWAYIPDTAREINIEENVRTQRDG